MELAEKKIRDANAKIELLNETKSATEETINERNEVLEEKEKSSIQLLMQLKRTKKSF